MNSLLLEGPWGVVLSDQACRPSTAIPLGPACAPAVYMATAKSSNGGTPGGGG